VLLSTAGRDAALMNIPASDYKAWANGLQRCKYATSTRYARDLIWIIERYKLCLTTY